jgi:hypothetical protein
MGVNLVLTTQTFAPAEDQRWLGSAHGTIECDTITLDTDDLLTDFPTGIVPSGVVLGKVTATGLHRKYDDAAVDGTAVAVGHLFQTVDLGGTTAGTTTDKIPAALFWHGEVVEAKLPAGHGLDAAAKVDLARIRYV